MVQHVLLYDALRPLLLLLLLLLLQVASMEHSGDAGDQLDIYKQQAKQIIKKLNPRSPAKCSIESGLYMFQCVRTSCTCPLGPYSVAVTNTAMLSRRLSAI